MDADLTQDEQKLMGCFRRMSPPAQGALIRFVVASIMQEDEKRLATSPHQVRHLRLVAGGRALPAADQTIN
jgi:hypothetical protein